eukprot:c9295_g1_i1.p1 GENE.c9295_g1_i1~~c9295_g1_i1.p1  ORF type:complete len:345 (+),score=111.09 c9295_g1_i1:456-1490(+)
MKSLADVSTLGRCIAVQVMDDQSGNKEAQESHVKKAVQTAQALCNTAVVTVRIPNVKWEDIGGLVEVKKEILDVVELPLKYPHLFSSGLRKRSGVLLYGPPGTGKTLLAKAVATECSLNFLGVKGPELIDMYVGESERNVRELFQKARESSPCVIFFDELDALAPNRGASGDGGGVMDRVVSQLLTELDGMQPQSNVFVIGATNRPDLIDPSLLRPGRFDRLLYLGLSDDRSSKLQLMSAVTRKFQFAPDVDLTTVVEQLSFGMTGADMYALCADALTNAITRKIQESEQAGVDLQLDLSATAQVTSMDFAQAIANFKPSVSREDMLRYKSLQDHFNEQRKHKA